MFALAATLPLLMAGSIALVPPGAFHGDEVHVRDGERWLGLQVSSGNAALVATRLRVQPVHDALLDAPGEATGREIGSDEESAVTVYLRGAALRPGPVAMAEGLSSDPASLHATSQSFVFREASYRIETHCDMEAIQLVSEQKQVTCRLLLHAPEATQVLGSRLGYFEAGSDVLQFRDDGQLRLLFAGDLDRDGRMDLLLDMSDHYNVSRPTLWLSSKAAEGDVVGEAAAFESVGC